MKYDLVERYIYAVTRLLPAKMRADVEMELDSLITEMLAERCGPITPSDKDIRVVLTDLGTPDELAAKYISDEHSALISGTYYFTYMRLLKIVMPIVCIAVFFSMLLAQIIELVAAPPNNVLFIFQFVGQAIGAAIAGAIWAFAVITFIFAVLERQQASIDTSDFLASLPSIPKPTSSIKRLEPIIGMVFSIAGVVLFIGFPQVFRIYFSDYGWLPVFNIQTLQSLWLPILGSVVLGLFKEAVKLVEGHYNARVAISTCLANALSMACMGYVLLNRGILNPDLLSHLKALLADISASGEGIIQALVLSSNAILFAIICFALILECATALFRTWKNRI
ncbi:MAG: hypothetical protein FWH40_04910 [Coriobacteriia bacterium]|nr:hypothetical protein [Coriobacteriia bacterium]